MLRWTLFESIRDLALMPIELFTRHFLGLFFLMIGLLYGCRSLGLSQRCGYSHIHYGEPGSATWWHRQSFNLFRAAILGVCLARIPFPIDGWLGMIEPLYQPGILLIGVALQLIAFALISYVQGYLNADWRSGIDQDHPPSLITDGPYGRSRNPIFLAILIGQFGFFLALPSLFSLVCLVVGAGVILRQARAEESALNRLHGSAYEEYRHRVPRWL
ncbi:methyltransferase family protein [Saccharospirillum salsuginis]|nr:isoprenylcysteine carboxylmethyltransferase family protein [Saccharospirillum salsuginis]